MELTKKQMRLVITSLESFKQRRVLNNNKFSPYKNYYQADVNNNIIWIILIIYLKVMNQVI